MLDSIEHKGYFFLPENPDHMLAGTLKCSQDDGIELDLFGYFDKFQNTSSKETNLILGTTANGKRMTLLNCYQKSGSMNFPGFPQSKISAIYLFFGHHFNSIDEIKFDSCSIEYEGLNHWLYISGFDKPNYDKGRKEYLVKYNTPQNIGFSFLENWDAEIVFDFFAPSDYFIPIDKVNLEQRPALKLVPQVKSSFQNFLNVTSAFTSFLSVNYYSYALAKSIFFYENIEKTDDTDDDKREVQLYYKTGIDVEKHKKHVRKQDYLFQYINYEFHFPEIIKEWFVLHGQIEVTINILTECFMDRSKPTELHFISLTQGIENMHKRVFIKSKLDFLERLNGIVDYLPTKVKDALLANESDFTKRIRDNRNYYTHYSDNYKLRAVPLGELFLLSEKLKVILMVAILKKISFSDEQIERMILLNGIYLFNHLIKIPRSVA